MFDPWYSSDTLLSPPGCPPINRMFDVFQICFDVFGLCFTKKHFWEGWGLLPAPGTTKIESGMVSFTFWPSETYGGWF